MSQGMYILKSIGLVLLIVLIFPFWLVVSLARGYK